MCQRLTGQPGGTGSGGGVDPRLGRAGAGSGAGCGQQYHHRMLYREYRSAGSSHRRFFLFSPHADDLGGVPEAAAGAGIQDRGIGTGDRRHQCAVCP